MAGTIWPDLTAGKKAKGSDVEAKFDWIEGSLVPMNGGDKTNGAYDLGEVAYHWDNAYIDSIQTNITIPNQSCARAYPSADQTIGSAAWTKVTLGTESFDVADDFSSSAFYALKSGYYQVNASAYYKNTIANSLHQIAIYKDGAEVITGFVQSASAPAGTTVNPVISDIIYLSATSYIELYSYHLSQTNTTAIDANSKWTFLSVRLLG